MRFFTPLWCRLPALLIAGCFSDGTSPDAHRQSSPCVCPSESAAALPTETEPPLFSGGVVRIAVDSEPGLLLSMFSNHPAISVMMNHEVLEALVALDPDTEDPHPVLARGYTISEDGREYTFFLEDTARWHDGTPFTAGDVVFTFDQILDPASGAIVRFRFEDVASVREVDAHTVSIQLDHPRRGFLADLSKVFILPEHRLRNETIVSGAYARAPIGTGPFQFEDWKKGEFISLIRNDLYRGTHSAADRIVYRIVPDRQVARRMFLADEVDIYTDEGNFEVPDGARRISIPEDGVSAWLYNTGSALFGDPDIRRATGMLIDREAIRCSILNCQAQVVHGLRSGRHWQRAPLAYDPAGARALLERRGWTDIGRDGIRQKNNRRLSFTLLLPDSHIEDRRAASVVQYDLKRAGIEMRILIVSRAVHRDRLRAGRFDASVLRISTTPPIRLDTLFHSRAVETGSNFGAFSDPVTDSLIDALETTEDGVQRRQVRQQLLGRLDELHPVTFTFRPYRQVIVHDRIFGVTIGPTGLLHNRLWRPLGDPAR